MTDAELRRHYDNIVYEWIECGNGYPIPTYEAWLSNAIQIGLFRKGGLV